MVIKNLAIIVLRVGPRGSLHYQAVGERSWETRIENR